ncbi:MAG: TolC family protein [Planctomycetota bacterium]|nr:MAG: TolC family protein [Planctomycetota bacterium]
MGEVDRATQAVIAERVAALGGGATAPRPFVGGEASDRGGWYEERPGTVNPPASALGFEPAAEARNVAELLRGYAQGTIAPGPDALTLGLEDVFRLAVTTSREHRQAEEDFILTTIALLIERHRWSPRLFNDTTVTVSGAGDGGTFDSALSVINALRLTQRLPFGGEVEAAWVARAAQELVNKSTNAYTSSSELVLSANIPLLRGAGRVAREDLIQAERETVYAARTYERFRRSLLVDIAADYFDLLQTKARIGNQQRQLDSQIRRQEETAAKVMAGRLNPFQNDIVANEVKQSQARLANLREQYVLQLERFKVRLGLDPLTEIDLGEIGQGLREPLVTPEQAVELALTLRLDLQNRRDRLIDVERAVANARNGLLPDFDVSGTVTVPTDPNSDQDGLEIDGESTRYSVGATFSLPLDRRIERLSLRQAQVRLERERRAYEEFRDGIVIEARQAVRAIDLARFQLQLAETQIEINRRGLEDLSLRDDADPQAIIDRQNALLDAENARDQALTDLRNAVLRYLLTTGQMRVKPDGTFDAPEGMLRPTTGDDDLGEATPYPEPDGVGGPVEEPSPDEDLGVDDGRP